MGWIFDPGVSWLLCQLSLQETGVCEDKRLSEGLRMDFQEGCQSCYKDVTISSSSVPGHWLCRDISHPLRFSLVLCLFFCTHFLANISAFLRLSDVENHKLHSGYVFILCKDYFYFGHSLTAFFFFFLNSAAINLLKLAFLENKTSLGIILPTKRETGLAGFLFVWCLFYFWFSLQDFKLHALPLQVYLHHKVWLYFRCFIGDSSQKKNNKCSVSFI